MENSNNNFRFSDVWNKALETKEEKLVEPKDYLWASELGKAPIDIFYKLKGVKPTNPPNARSLRKFEAGNVWEDIVKLVLMRAGILRSSQERAEYQYPEMLRVSGRLDFIAGGKPDFEKAKKDIEELRGVFPDVVLRGSNAIVEYIQAQFPDGIPMRVLEIKSVSSFMYESMLNSECSSAIHRKQLYHYMKCKNLDGSLIYICKDDCRMLQFDYSLSDQKLEEEYYKSIETITKYYKNDQEPPKEDPIIYDQDLQKFVKNFNVAYSMYLTKLYGFKDQAEFDDKYGPIAESWNRVLTRIKQGKELTDNNKEKLAQMSEYGFLPEVKEIKVQTEVGVIINKIVVVNNINPSQKADINKENINNKKTIKI